ncbi:MAG TPA: type IV pilus secretin PilQ [Burkholderiaceae bacterium]|jgi:type IV pilus assembly protein PilQ|nr:type IV pilus secretin PilQ [Burkholderiaceae bacterium]
MKASFSRILRTAHAAAVLAGLMAAAGEPAFAQEPAATNSIERIDATQTSTGVFLTIQLKEPLTATPTNFSVTNPARVAIDLPLTVNNLGRSSVEINQGDLRSVNVIQATGRSRIVLNLKTPVTYTVTAQGNTVQITLGTKTETATFPGPQPVAPAGAATPVTPGTPIAAAAPGPRTIRNIDFRRGAVGEGRVVVDLSDPTTSVDIRQQGQQVLVDFLNTTVPESLRRRLDVTDFGTPIAQVSTIQQGSNVHMVIEPRGLWEQNAYQSDTHFVVEVKPVKEDPTRLFQGTRQGYQGERLSLNFQNVDVRSLLQVIADFTNLNIITSDSVQGAITLRLKDVPWDQALDIILQSKGLDMRKNGNVILVAPRDELATKEKLELEARSQILELEPLHTENFVVNYQKADDVRRLLVDDKQRMLSKRGSVVVDIRTNQLFVQDTNSTLEAVRQLISRIDVPVPQVLIEARIVEADDEFSRDIGARLGIAHFGPHTWVNSGAGSSFSPLPPGTTTCPTGLSVMCINGFQITNPNFVNLPAASLNGFNPGSIGLTLFNSQVSSVLNLEISALELDGRGKVISSPRVVTADKVKASIEQGNDIPYQTNTQLGGPGQIQFRKAVLRLEVTPQITPEGSIFLDVKVNKDTPSATVSGSGGIAIDTKNVTTQVLVENGGTVVLGGIYQQTERTTVTKIPFLGDIPVVGNLFKDQFKQNNRTELLIFITPRVISEKVTQAARS